ncbi:hypothetical protein [Poseidonocella sp. HB161398]|uniref:hypothetical protein n=1 Tax=Poseidonocella sp. HB161398 TaxID=2320855 RepID=UPI001486A114|nr:hypothetical protein [Poseidonocella sp. HB161398]
MDAALARAELAVPPERRPAMPEPFCSYRVLAALMHVPLDPASEPLGLYRPGEDRP